MGASIDGLLVGGAALGVFVFTRWLLKKLGPNYKLWDAVSLTILLLAAFGMVALMLGGPLPDWLPRL